MRGQSVHSVPRGSVLELRAVPAAGGLEACREASGHIAYKSPGCRHTEHCLARVTATLPP